jgi:fructoselysine 6-kinase
MRFVSLGDNVVDVYPQLGLMFPGGQALNVAVGMRRHGADSAYVGVVGDDEPGRHIHSVLEREDVGTTRLRTARGRTASAVVQVIDGERFFTGSDPGVSEFTPDTDDLCLLETADLAFVSCNSGLDGHLAELAQRCPLAYDFSTRQDPTRLSQVLPHCTAAVLSVGDSSEGEVEDLIRAASAQGPRWVIATRGSRGATLFADGVSYSEPALPVPVVDTLGAGDAFAARALFGLVIGEPVERLMEGAARSAATTCSFPGAFGHGRPISTDLQAVLERLSIAPSTATQPRTTPSMSRAVPAGKENP